MTNEKPKKHSPDKRKDSCISDLSSSSGEKPLSEKEILQYLYDEGNIDFSGDEDDLTLHYDTTNKGLINMFRFGYEFSNKKWKEAVEKLKAIIKISEDNLTRNLEFEGSLTSQTYMKPQTYMKQYIEQLDRNIDKIFGEFK